MSTVKSNYKVNVLEFNKALKTEIKSLNGAIKFILIGETHLSNDFKKVLKDTLKNEHLYKEIANNVRKGKKGFVPFYILQYLHKNTEALQKLSVMPKAIKKAA